MFNHPFKLTLSLLLLTLLAGCASYQAADADDPLAQTPNWHLRGKLGIITPEERVSASLHWRHLGRTGQDDLRLTGPFGQTLLALNARPGFAEVELDGRRHQGDSPEQLIQRLTGWQLPLSQLSRYLLGDTASNPTTSYDEQGHPVRLDLVHPGTGEQWQLTYNGWQQLSQHRLPRELELRQGPQRIKLAISHWQPEL
ncbi:lipoprotein insertase outer membrane protein LolB [Ferrimonas marina]|uniref:Outer-membrane lipoprotein LolB n=1 Tax=Ferrimonas marina TaxID=299255 RepID=A0A1M5SDC8_9GAMM|nr:lipoprotein insertase outer membrane protein LolB [Ferrimonas marina]SHH36298.1 outer membrane lipoprotein LolB [Ferrimonas marina]